MDETVREINIYCDESSIDNPDNQFMIIGGLFVNRKVAEEIKLKIKVIKEKYNYFGEIKWTKLSDRSLPLYKELIDLFTQYSSEDIQFHCIKIDRKKVNYPLYHDNDKERGFYKFYYQLFKNKFCNYCSYYIFLDYKPTKSKKRVPILEHYLKYRILKSCPSSRIKHIQAFSSKSVSFIQIADIFTGAVGYEANGFSGSKSKKAFNKYLATKLKQDNLNFCSPLYEEKFNIFCIKLTDERR